MMLTKLKAVAAALVLGVITAGAIVWAQPPGGGRAEPSDPPTKTGRPSQAVAARGGNVIVDWIPVEGKGGKKEVTVDPKRHCFHLPRGPVSLMRDDRLNDGMVYVELERGKYFKVTASGEAFMSDSTGADADPFAGVVVLYTTDEEDCFAERQIVMASGKSITFRAPWLTNPPTNGYLMAFFLDTWPGHPKRGSYTLTIEETGEQAAAEHTIKAPFDGIITERGRSVNIGGPVRPVRSVDMDRSHTTTSTASPARRDAKARDRTNSSP
jgi:hypothetical protein